MSKCRVEGKKVIPCELLDQTVDDLYTRIRKGIFDLVVTNLDTGEQYTHGFGTKSGEHKKGLMFNFCPFCGEDIGSHLKRKSSVDNSGGTVDNSKNS